jgi:chromosome partitioning protein
MGSIYSFANHKGGVGKTTTCINIGACLAIKNRKVLLVDLDPQSNLTIGCGFYQPFKNNIYSLLSDKIKINESIINHSNNLDLIPSTLDLSASELELGSRMIKEKVLSKILNKVINHYDYILIDCPPSLGLLTVNALTASDKIFIPIQSEFFALYGLAKFVQVIKDIQEDINPRLSIGGVIVTRYDNRKILNRDVVTGVKEYFGDKLLKTFIRENIALAEAPGKGKNIFEFSKNSNGAKDYLNLTEEIINME